MYGTQRQKYEFKIPAKKKKKDVWEGKCLTESRQVATNRMINYLETKDKIKTTNCPITSK